MSPLPRTISLAAASVLLACALPALAPTAAAASPKPVTAPAAQPTAPKAAPAADAPVTSVTVTGADLTPAFDPSITDYAVWCQGIQNDLTFTINGEAVPVSLAQDQAYQIASNGVTYWFRCLPSDFPRSTTTWTGAATGGYYLTDTHARAHPGLEPTYVMIYDSHGTPVWYNKAPSGGLNVRRVSPTMLAWSPSSGAVGSTPDSQLEFYDLTTGTVTKMGPSVGLLDLHEFIPTKSGGWAWFNTPRIPVNVTTKNDDTKQATTAANCVLQEVDTNGNATWTWDASAHIPQDQAMNPIYTAQNWPLAGQQTWDPYHCNAIDQDPATGDYFISMRNQSAIYRISRATGDVLWQIGGKNGGVAQQYFTVTGDPYGGFAAQHDIRILRDAAGTITGFTVFDNHYIFSGAPTQTSRGVRYDLDLTAHTAPYVSALSNPAGTTARYTGSYRIGSLNDPLLPAADTANLGEVISWGHAGGFSDFASGQLALNLTWPGDRSYRTVKEPLSAFDINLLRQTAGKRTDSTTNAALCRSALQLKMTSTPTIGAPVGPLVTSLRDGGCYQNTTGGAYVWSPATGMWTSTTGAIRTLWGSTGYENGSLGYPLMDQDCALTPAGCLQHYQGGTILWSQDTGAHVVSGTIRDAYAALKWQSSSLGYPTSDQSCAGSTCQQQFQQGTIYSSPAGAFATTEPIRAAYIAAGGPAGGLGAPTSSTICGLRFNGCSQNFQNGTLYWTSGTGAVVVRGAIRGRYQANGAENSALGYPIGPETCGIRAGGCYQNFQGGAILWSPATGAHANYGPIRDKYRAVKFENSGLGYPTSEIVCGLKDGGCYQNYEGGAILWSPATGAHTSWGAIRTQYQARGFEDGVLGYPTSDEVCGIRAGGCYQDFQGGAILWSPATGAYASYGPIRDKYRAVNFENSARLPDVANRVRNQRRWLLPKLRGRRDLVVPRHRRPHQRGSGPRAVPSVELRERPARIPHDRRGLDQRGLATGVPGRIDLLHRQPRSLALQLARRAPRRTSTVVPPARMRNQGFRLSRCPNR